MSSSLCDERCPSETHERLHLDIARHIWGALGKQRRPPKICKNVEAKFMKSCIRRTSWVGTNDRRESEQACQELNLTILVLAWGLAEANYDSSSPSSPWKRSVFWLHHSLIQAISAFVGSLLLFYQLIKALVVPQLLILTAVLWLYFLSRTALTTHLPAPLLKIGCNIPKEIIQAVEIPVSWSTKSLQNVSETYLISTTPLLMSMSGCLFW